MKKSSEKSFGILFFIVFLFVGFWPVIEGQGIRIWSIIVSLIFLTLGIFNSKILTPLNNSWIKLGEILGKIIAPIVMALIYFTVLTPISLIIRIFGKDLLEKKFSKKNSYWIKREKNIGSMKKQF